MSDIPPVKLKITSLLMSFDTLLDGSCHSGGPQPSDVLACKAAVCRLRDMATNQEAFLRLLKMSIMRIKELNA